MSFRATTFRALARGGWGGRAASHFRGALYLGVPDLGLPLQDPQVFGYGTQARGQIGSVVYRRPGAAVAFAVAGVSRDSTGVIVPYVVMKLYRTADDVVLATTVSDISGNFSFNNTPSGPFYIRGYKVGSPDLAGTTVNTVMGGPPVEQPLRYASPTNNFSYALNTSDSTYTHLISRKAHFIGSGDMSELRIALFGWCSSPGGSIQFVGNDFSYDNIYICKLGAASGFNVRFQGKNSVTVPNGIPILLSDPIYPSQFGLTKFTRGERYDVTFDTTLPGAGISYAQLDDDGAYSPGNVYDDGYFSLKCGPGDTTFTNVNSYGAVNWSGPTINPGVGMNHVLLGRFITGDPGVMVGVGDSIIHGTGSAGGMMFGLGPYFHRALFSTDGTTLNPIAGCNLGIPSGDAFIWQTTADVSQAYLSMMLRFGNTFLEEYGINDIVFTGGAPEAATLLATSEVIYQLIRNYTPPATSKTLKIGRLPLLAKTSSGTPQAGCGPGETLDYFNQQIVTAATGAPGPDEVINARQAVISGSTPGTTAYFQWGSGMTSDEVHPSELGHQALAVTVRAWTYANL